MLRYCTLLLLSITLALTTRAQEQTCTATVETVARQAGEAVVFCGEVTEVHVPKKMDGPLLLNFGGKYPDNTFSVVIFPDVAGDDRGKLVKRFTGKKVRVSGEVKTYNGKPEIVIKSMKDIEEE